MHGKFVVGLSNYCSWPDALDVHQPHVAELLNKNVSKKKLGLLLIKY